MDFRLLGPLEVATDDGAADVGSGKRAALLIYLLLHAGDVVSADRLIDELWGERAPATAAKSVQVYVSQLRKALRANGNLLATRGGGYVLNVTHEQVDVRRFERMLAEAQHALEEGDAERASAAAQAALELWRGPALYDVAYESFAQTEAARLEELRLVALETRIEADLALGRHAQAVAELEMLVAEHPARERFRAQLMLALYRCGRQSDALEAYRRGSRLLMDEFALEPSPELRALEQKIFVHSAELAAPRTTKPHPRPAPLKARRRSVWLLLAGGLLLVVAATLALLERGGGSGLTHAGRGDAVALIDPATGRVAKTFTVGYTPDSVTVGRGAVWALNADDQTISHIDVRSGSVTTFGVGATPTDLVAGAGALWVGGGTAERNEFGAAADRVLRVDPSRDAVSTSVDLPGASGRAWPGAPGQLAFGAGALWALGGGETLTRIDPREARVTATTRVPRLKAITVAGTSVWAIVRDTTDVVQIDARSLHVRRRVHLAAGRLDAIEAGAGAVWVADAVDGALWRIEPGGTVVTKTIDVGAGADGVAVGAGAVWVVNSVRGTALRVDPRTDRVTKTVSLGGTPRDLAIGAGGIWVADAGSAAAIRAANPGPGQRFLPRSVCGELQTVSGNAPERVIVSDFPLDQTDAARTQPMAAAIAFVLRRHHFRAGGYRLGYQSCDDSTAEAGQWDPDKCTANARAYAETRAVLGVIGPMNSGCTTAELATLNRARIPMVSPSNDVIGLTIADPTAPAGALRALYPTGVRNYVRIEPSEKAEAAADALLAKRLALRRVYVLDDGEPYGGRNAELFRAAARAVGVPVAGVGHWDAGGRGFAAVVARVARSHANGVYLGGLSSPPTARFVGLLRARLGAATAFIAPVAMGPADFMYEQSHGGAVGLYTSAAGGDAYAPTATVAAASRPFVHDFAATQPGTRIDLTAVYAAAATEVLLDAIARSDGTRASATHALLRTRLAHSVIGPIRFDANGDVRPAPVTILRIAATRISSLPYATHAGVYDVITPPERLLR